MRGSHVEDRVVDGREGGKCSGVAEPCVRLRSAKNIGRWIDKTW